MTRREDEQHAERYAVRLELAGQIVSAAARLNDAVRGLRAAEVEHEGQQLANLLAALREAP